MGTAGLGTPSGIRAATIHDTYAERPRHPPEPHPYPQEPIPHMNPLIAAAVALVLTLGCSRSKEPIPEKSPPPPAGVRYRTSQTPRTPSTDFPAAYAGWVVLEEHGHPPRTKCIDKKGKVVLESSLDTMLFRLSENLQYAGTFENEVFHYYGPTCRKLWSKADVRPFAGVGLSAAGDRVVLNFTQGPDTEGGDKTCWLEIFDRKGRSIWRPQEYKGPSGYCSKDLRLSANGRYGYGYRVPTSDTAFFIFDVKARRTHRWEIPRGDTYDKVMHAATSSSISDAGVFRVTRDGKVLYEFKFE